MSGVVGLYNLNGKPVNRHILERMSQAIAPRGPDGAGMWIQGSVGLASRLLRVTPESANETQPLVDAAGPALVFDGRLDNREELLGRLQGDPAISRESSDPALMLAAYQMGGERLPQWLTGDFAFALFDPKARQLLLARDAIGVRPLYYCRIQETFLFASEIKALLTHPGVCSRPNDDVLAQFLLNRRYDPRLTFFTGIFSLLPAHTLILTPQGLRTQRYWDFDPSARVRCGSFQEYTEAFRAVFEQAVRRRLRSRYPVAVEVSGGLDSSSILCQAERVVRNDRSPCPGLVGVSNLSPEGTPSDEQVFLTDIETQYGSRIHRIPSKFLGRATGSEEQAWQIEAPFLDAQWGDTLSSLETAHQSGARVVLDGHWGDQVLASRAYLIDLVRRLRWITVQAHLKEYGRWFTDVEPHVFYRLFFRSLAKSHIPDPLWPFLRRLRRGTQAGPWYSAAFQQCARQRPRERALTTPHFPTAHAASIYQEARIGYHVLCMEVNNKVAASHGLERAYPFLDRDLIAFMMGIPGDIQAWHGIPKALLREAMRGILPEAIRRRTWKGDSTHLLNGLTQREYPHLVHCLHTGEAVERGYLDGVRLTETLAPLHSGLTNDDCQAAWVLWDVLSLEHWLRVFWKGATQIDPLSQ